MKRLPILNETQELKDELNFILFCEQKLLSRMDNKILWIEALQAQPVSHMGDDQVGKARV